MNSEDEDRERYSRLRNERDDSTERRRSRTRSRSRPRRRHHRGRSESRRAPSQRREEGKSVPIEQVEKLLQDQQSNLLDIISNHKDEIDSLVSSKKHNFKKPGIGKQFDWNNKIERLVKKALKKGVKKENYKKARDLLEEVLDLISDKQEDLMVADSSRHGWLTVACVRNTASDLPTELQKRIEKVESRLDKSKSARQERNGENPGHPGKWNQQHQRSFGNIQRPTTSYGRQPTNPEELLNKLKNMVRQGKCGFCQGEGHFYKECPSFWADVSASRKALTASKSN